MDTTQTTLYHAILITSVILGLVFAYFTYTIFRSRRRYFRVLRKHMVKQAGLLEKERTRIAHNLHDDLGPLLTVIKIQVAVAGTGDAGKNALLDKACNNLDRVHERLAAIARNLIPAFLKRKGLVLALQDYFEQCEESSSIRIRFISELNTRMNENMELQVYRMIEELVNNAIKYSKATNIAVQLKERKNRLYIHCKDNGIGIPGSNPEDLKEGIGLQSLNNRVEVMGGRSRFTTKNGTHYFFEIPIIKISHE